MAGEADAERLVVLLEARIRDFERNLQKASGTADNAYNRMRRGSRTATEAMERDMMRSTNRINQALAQASTRVGAYGKAFAVGFLASAAASLSFGRALDTAKQALTEFDRIGKSAKSAGLDPEFLQELEHAAMLGGVGIDQLSQALITFNKNAGMAAIGKGELVEKLKLLDEELLTNIQRTTDQEERLRLVADALEKETDASRRAAIASAAFGDAGVKMVTMLRGGADALDDVARKARDMGLIVDRHLIASAEQLNDEYSTATRIMDLQFKQAMVNLAPVLISTANLAARLAGDIRGIVDAFSAVEAKSNQALDTRMADLGMERLRVENEILDIKRQQDEMTGATAGLERRYLDGTIAKKKEELAAIAEQEEHILGILKQREQVETAAPTVQANDNSAEYLTRYREELKLSADARKLATETERILSDAMAQGAAITHQQAEELARLTIARDASEKAATKGASATKKLTAEEKAYNGVLQLQSDLLFEREQMFRNPVEQRVAYELRSVGLELNSVRGEQLATEIRINEQIARARDQYEDMAATVRDTLGGAFVDVFSGAIKSTDELLDRLAGGFAQIGKMNLKAFFDNIGQQGFGGGGSSNPAIDDIAAGVKQGTFDAWDGLRKVGGGSSGGSAAMGVLGVAAGGFGMGYESQSPVMGALSGALSGAAAGSVIPGIGTAIGAVVGPCAGRMGNLFKEKSK